MQLSALLFSALLAVGALSAPTTETLHKRAVDQATYDDLYRAARLSKAAYQDRCTSPLGLTKVMTIRSILYDTDGFIVKDDAKKEIVVAFRGTSGLADIRIDLRNDLVRWTSPGSEGCSSCTVHEGFQQQWNAVASDVISTVRTLISQNPTYGILVTGHSLGGALSTLATASLAATFPSTPLRGIGFASPRVGNPAFAAFANNLYNDRYKRVTHTADNVPQDLTQAEGYQHVATEYWISADPAGAGNIVRCNGGEDPKCNKSVAKENQGIAGINADHYLYFFNFRDETVPCS
ncbi:alpha/beta-hydrolase [Ascodesmis nigricans]|uniref:Alpha/beta-hydrolase n=1 Tax=Ascodesmis nigricans TaxID=341454 RepID=A0A4S2MUQ6_9PEZI|nr:alpha/beta-hydrolase [Ascodesmis nigricans]